MFYSTLPVCASYWVECWNVFQMTKFCLGTSTSLLHDLMEKTLTLYAKRQSPIPDLLHLALEAGSNIVKAVTLAAASQSDLWFFREKLSKSIKLVERFLQVCITSPSICWLESCPDYFTYHMYGSLSEKDFWESKMCSSSNFQSAFLFFRITLN